MGQENARSPLAMGPDPIIISRMINNSRRRWILPIFGILAVLSGVVALASCRDRQIHAEDHLQGVVEYEERSLSLEVGGRVESVRVKRGDAIEPGKLLVSLDDGLEKTAREARAAEAEAARSQTELLQAGTRPEEIRSMSAQVRSAKASETLLEKTLGRERSLLAKNASTQAAVDDLQARLDSARANRQSLEHKLSALRRGARPEEIESARSRAVAADKSVKLGDERVDRYALRAPIAGTVLDVHVESGEVVGPGTPVITLGDTRRPYVDVFVPLGKLDGIVVGAPASLRVDGTDRVFSARVDWIARTTEFTPRFLFSERERPNLVVRVRLLVDDPEQRLHAGIPAFATIEQGTPDAAQALR
jgi:HlyD family secretion protein